MIGQSILGTMDRMEEKELREWFSHLDKVSSPIPIQLAIMKELANRIQTKIPAKGCKTPSIPPSWVDCSDGDKV